jgi:hypothetical protein
MKPSVTYLSYSWFSFHQLPIFNHFWCILLDKSNKKLVPLSEHIVSVTNWYLSRCHPLSTLTFKELHNMKMTSIASEHNGRLSTLWLEMMQKLLWSHINYHTDMTIISTSITHLLFKFPAFDDLHYSWHLYQQQHELWDTEQCLYGHDSTPTQGPYHHPITTRQQYSWSKAYCDQWLLRRQLTLVLALTSAPLSIRNWDSSKLPALQASIRAVHPS